MRRALRPNRALEPPEPLVEPPARRVATLRLRELRALCVHININHEGSGFALRGRLRAAARANPLWKRDPLGGFALRRNEIDDREIEAEMRQEEDTQRIAEAAHPRPPLPAPRIRPPVPLPAHLANPLAMVVHPPQPALHLPLGVALAPQAGTPAAPFVMHGETPLLLSLGSSRTTLHGAPHPP